MSWCERGVSLSSTPTICPGPTVHGPPVKSITRAPMFGKAVSSSDTAIDAATPVQRCDRASFATGHGSRFSSASTFEIANSASVTGSTKREAAERPSAGCAPRLRDEGWAMPSRSASCCGGTSLVPLKVYDLEQCSNPSSCTCTTVPYVISPSIALGALDESSCSTCSSESLRARSSASSTQVSMTHMNTGGPAGARGSAYSIVV
mmetsp:Transcript_5658/g.13099  ORF Transcript_5658/g.13099 Transcript_5658/m.13099 type:complete len:205 (-) Transcript_5658:407-1021(-)